MNKFSALILLIVALGPSFISTNKTSALTCASGSNTLLGARDSADVVFDGRVKNIDKVVDATSQNIIEMASFEVSEYWNGPVGEHIGISVVPLFRDIYPGENSEFFFKKGERYIVFADYRDGKIVANITCSMTNRLDDEYYSKEVIPAFGPGTKVTRGICGNFNRNLTIGSTGLDVIELQTILEAKGFLKMPNGVAKGYFGNLTRTALASYQASADINPAKGYFGPISRAKLSPVCAQTAPGSL